MTLYSFAVFTIPLAGLGWFVDAVAGITDLIEYIENVLGPGSATYHHYQERGMEMLLVRMAIYALAGVVQLGFARPLAHLLLRGIADTTKEMGAGEVWPPPPTIHGGNLP